jgi:DNA-binding IclR family transcriptional regulator
VAGNGSEPRRTVISKVVAIVRSFGSGSALTVTEIAQVADLPLSTTHRLVHELAAWGILLRNEDARYELVLQSRSSGRCADGLPDMRAVAAPVIEDLGAVTRNDVRFGLLDGVRVLYVEKAYGPQPLSGFSYAATLPTHATAVGQAVLAFSPPDVVDRVIRHGLQRFTGTTGATAARLRHALKVTRLRGMAIACGELLPGHSAVAVPVFGPGGDVVAALEVRVGDLSVDLPTVVPALTVAARGLSRELARIGDVPAAVHPAPRATEPGRRSPG